MKRPTQLPFDQLYDRLRPMDMVTFMCIADDIKKGKAPVVKTRWGDNSLTVLSYAGLVGAKQNPREFPIAFHITSRGVKFLAYIQSRTTIEQLVEKLPMPLLAKIKKRFG